MASMPERRPIWWDRDVDDQGVPIRADVRQAAHELWPDCCARVRSALGDIADAPELMESSVSHVSRYLDRAGAAPAWHHAKSLLSLHFCQELKRRAGRLSRIKAVGLDSELDVCAPGPDWVGEVNLRLDFEKLRSCLTKRSCIIVLMRNLGHDWQEIGEKLGIAISTAQNSFREDLRKARTLLHGKNEVAKPNGKAGGK